MSKEHWENIYKTKGMKEVSWYQEIPKTSLDIINTLASNKEVSIIDVGGGDGFLVDELLKIGYTNITVLDISENAIKRAKERLGTKADRVTWIVSDITNFKPKQQYDIWHDRAVFHFLITEEQQNAYAKNVEESVADYLLLATFSDEGPSKCSGLEICKYSEKELGKKFQGSFQVLDSFKQDHDTPFGTKQNFTFSVFRKVRG